MLEGFSEKSTEFVWELRFHNSKDWFLAHRQEYERYLLKPIRELAFGLQAYFSEKYPAHSWQVHISRIYRDARRLHGRGPMNDHLWFSLFADGEKDGITPAFYFGFAPEGYDFGMGCWTQNGIFMERLRSEVQKHPAALDKLRKDFEQQTVFALNGEEYKRPKVQVKPELMPWVNRKYLGFHCDNAHGKDGFGPGLFETVRQGYESLMPLYEYFLQIAHRAE